MSDYVISHDYEFYIRLARNCERGEYGADHRFMLNLMDEERDDVSTRQYAKLLSDAKKYMLSATRFALNRKLEKNDKTILKNFVKKIQSSETSVELLPICKEGRELFSKYISSSDSM